MTYMRREHKLSFHLISFHLKQGKTCFPGEQAGQKKKKKHVSRIDGCDRNRKMGPCIQVEQNLGEG